VDELLLVTFSIVVRGHRDADRDRRADQLRTCFEGVAIGAIIGARFLLGAPA
jgi:hypothetical protein